MSHKAPVSLGMEGGRRTKRVSAQPQGSKKRVPVLRRVPARLGLNKTYKRCSTSFGRTPITVLESKYPVATPSPCPPSDATPPSKSEALLPSRDSIPWPTSPSMRGSLIMFPGRVLVPSPLHGEGSGSHVMDEFDAAASDVMSDYTSVTGASSSILHAFRDFGEETETEAEEGEEEEDEFVVDWAEVGVEVEDGFEEEQGTWDPLEEADPMIIALRVAEAKEAAARNREERIREAIRQRAETQGGQGRRWD